MSSDDEQRLRDLEQKAAKVEVQIAQLREVDQAQWQQIRAARKEQHQEYEGLRSLINDTRETLTILITSNKVAGESLTKGGKLIAAIITITLAAAGLVFSAVQAIKSIFWSS